MSDDFNLGDYVKTHKEEWQAGLPEEDMSIHFFDGVSATYGRFYVDNVKSRKRKVELAKHPTRDTGFWAEDRHRSDYDS